ncbi:MAG TPA: MFS transporter [Acidimicrobiia bacterium]|nr:MFS transporter [Acidimicrobiia bacterium]HIL46377.1 MFS transporter [Acidimicrobiia bacterium]
MNSPHQKSTGRYPAMRHRNYRLFWTGGLITNNGRWIRMVAGSWVMYTLTDSASWVGFAAFASMVPMFVMNPLSGWISDHRNRRNTLLITNGLQAVVAVMMALVWAQGVSSPWPWVVLLAVGGMINGVRLPVWQAFVAECVPRSELPNAIALNSTQFNAARATGPAIGGLIIGTWGPGWALLAVAIFHLPVAIALVLIDPTKLVSGQVGDPENQPTVWGGFREGVRYVWGAPGIRTAILSVMLIAAFAMPLVQQVVVFAEEVFEVSPFWFGVLGSAQGIGGVLVAPWVAGMAGNLRRSRVQVVSLVGYGVAVVIFGLAPSFWVGFAALMVIGGVHLLSATNLNSTVQLQVDDAVRGRVMAIYLLGMLGVMPFSNLLVGALISAFGPRPVVVIGGVLLGLGGLGLFWSGKLDHLDD